MAKKPLPPKLAYTVDETAYVMGISRSHVYELNNRGVLRIRLLAGRNVCLATEIEALVNAAFE